MKKTIHHLLFYVFLLITVGACKNDDDFSQPSLPTLTITNINPTKARVGEEITITGTGFDTLYRSRNKVLFSGSNVGTAIIKKEGTTQNQLTLNVPARTITGSVTITVGNQTVMSDQVFTLDTSLPPPVIASVFPGEGFVNDEITITGSNFVDGLDEPTVFFNDLSVIPVSADSGEIIVQIPELTVFGEVELRVERSGFSSENISFIVNKTPVAVRSTYWTSQNNQTISRGLIEETGVVIDILYDSTDGVSNPKGIAIDSENDFIYWVNGFSADVVRASLDGSGNMETIYTIGSFSLSDMAIDTDTQTMYIIDSGTDPNTFQSFISVYKGNLNDTGSGLETIATIPNAFFASGYGGIKIDSENGKFYIGASIYDLNTFQIIGYAYEGNLDGSGTLQEIYGGPGSGLIGPTNISVEPESGKIYIADVNSSVWPAVTTIYEGNLDGSGSLTPFVMPGGDLEATSDLEIDTENNFLFWINSTDNGSIKRATLDGTTVEDLFNIPAGTYFDIEIR
ncbi:IPT/TIG domain-containing protein [Abyssalbus ytuae]|uniref:IPT/TIG domain-containing protein n=1 Tax=Abyssalbus ytuae TaxID=2926907 RepID=A0A9E7D2U9_9FLAO|nr:IPT/TIG domain-containing protein [Abyssalbus ytuae]UOB17094.1 IPT/TIG domain-containing protein [Abyssalbus ytuae]